MQRRIFCRQVALATAAAAVAPGVVLSAAAPGGTTDNSDAGLDPALRRDWLRRWEEHIVAELHNRYCDKEAGEELGWLVSPFLNGFYYGFLATRDARWLERLVDWTDSCLKRAVKEPDGFAGWPKGAAGGGQPNGYEADSLLGEAMLLRPVVLAAAEIQRVPELKSRWDDKARGYIKFAEEIFQKWELRDCWREVKSGGLWVVPAFGIDPKTGKWSTGYEQRKSTGFSNPDNKQNHIARWLLAMSDVTQRPVYRERASQWFALMKSRMRLRDAKYYSWYYWEPAGPWDYDSDGSPRHWVGVHPNGGYYQIDVEGIVAAFEHGLVFDKTDIDRLVVTNRDFMWNQRVSGARFQSIDGSKPDPRWKDSPGLLWTALVPYDITLRKIFLANNQPDAWAGLIATPWFLSLGKH